MEHRWGRRVAVGLRIRLATGDQDIASGFLSDVSISGAFIATRVELAPLAILVIDLRDPATPVSKEADSAVLTAGVVRVASDGVGVEWEELAPPAITALIESLPTHYFADRQGTAIALSP
jgi:hypothetical protein